MDQVVIVVVIGLISLVNWLMKRSAELREQRKLEREEFVNSDPFHELPDVESADLPAPSVRQPSAASDEMRRIMELMGMPLEEEAPPPLPVQPVLPVLPKYQSPKPARPAKPVSSRSEGAAETPGPSALTSALRSRTGIRQAVVLREILGPPKAFTL
jgi:hypothetical protein